MGTRVAPSLANIFMADFEEQYVFTYSKQPIFYKRYLDDLLLIWTHGRSELEKFVKYLNQCHQSIKFTMEASAEKVDFLDTTIHLTEEGGLWTDLFCKPTDSHTYLHYSSAHTHHNKKSLPYSQLLCLKRICSNLSDWYRHSTILLCHFARRGYPLPLLQESFVRAG